MTNLAPFSTRLVLLYTPKWTNPRIKTPGLVMSLEILNLEFKVGTLKPKTLESGEFCCVNSLLSNLDILPPVIL